TRPRSKTGYTGAIDATAVPTPKRPIEVRNRPRVENRSMRNAETGIMIPLAIKNAVVIHWTWPVVMSKARWIDGSAVANSVSLVMPMNAPVSSAAIMRNFCRFDSPRVCSVIAGFPFELFQDAIVNVRAAVNTRHVYHDHESVCLFFGIGSALLNEYLAKMARVVCSVALCHERPADFDRLVILFDLALIGKKVFGDKGCINSPTPVGRFLPCTLLCHDADTNSA